MNKEKTKIVATTIVLVLMLGAFLAAIAPANAQTVTTRTLSTYSFIAVNPNPIGVGQPLQVSFWLADPPPTAAGAGGGRWESYNVKITKPDGTIETKGPYKSDAVGGAYFTYYPSATGTYTFKMEYTGQLMTGIGTGGFTGISGPFSFTYLPSTATTTLTVQQAPVTNPPQAPLPTSYWTRPIQGENLDWAQVSGNWLMAGWNSTARGFDAGSAVTAEGKMPETAHILWTKEMSFGGLVGGQRGPSFFHDGRSYEYWFKPPVIISGRLYYNTIGANEPIPANAYTRPLGMPSITCVDLDTGETIMTIPNATLSFGQIYNYVSPNQAGSFAYLWTNDWRMFDAWTGQYILTLVGVPSGTTVFGANGEIMIYNLANNVPAYPGEWVLSLWNSSKAIPMAGDAVNATSNYWQWRPYNYAGQIINATGTTILLNPDYGVARVRDTNGFMWRVPVYNITGQALSTFLQSGMYEGKNNILSLANGIQLQAMDMTTGAKQYNSTLQVPTNIPAIDGLVGIGNFQNTYESNGVFYEFLKATMQWIAYDVKTGALKWVSEPLDNAWGMYVPSCIAAYGKFFAGSYDGALVAYDINTGAKLWTYFPGSAGFQTPYGVWPIYSGLTAADGKIIFTTSEHGNGVEPLYSGEKIYVVDAATGKNYWNVTGWFEQMVVADGKLLSHNCYDNRLYAFGKGPSATTVESALAGVTVGSNVVIQGTVTDQSVGAKGTPAIADADMSEWMAYLYMQKGLSTDAKGVPVKLTAVDPNGNTVDIATVTSDMGGNYAFMWTPTMEGMYSIGATFEGSGSYYGSYAETHIAVSKAAAVITPSVTPTVEPTVAPTATASPSPVPNTGSGLGTEVYIAIAAAAVIAIVAAAALILRKRK